MAIMYGEEGEIVVRIKRYQKTCYDEYVHLEPRESKKNKNIQRYIIADPDTQYYVIVALTNGFDFFDYKLLRANLFIDNKKVANVDFKPPQTGTKVQIRMRQKIERSDLDVGEQIMGSHFVFKSIEIDPDQTKSQGAIQKGIPTIKIDLEFHKTITETLSDDQFNKEMSSWRKDCSKLRTAPPKPVRSKTTMVCYPSCIFEFHCRSAEALEKAGIVRYPPPIYLYRWIDLTINEKKTAFEQLQDLELKHLNGGKENETGQTLPLGDFRRRETNTEQVKIKELRSWGKLYSQERLEAFEIMQARQKARERGEVQSPYRDIKGDIITFAGGAQTGVPAEASPGRNMLAATPVEYKTKAPILQESPTATSSQKNVAAHQAEETPAASLLKPSTKPNITDDTTPKDKQVTLKVKSEPIGITLLDSDDDIMLVSATEWWASKAKKTAEPDRFIKQETVESAHEEQQGLKMVKQEGKLEEDDKEILELQRLRELEKEKKKIQLDMELLKNEKRLNEINETLEAVEAKRRKIE